MMFKVDLIKKIVDLVCINKFLISIFLLYVNILGFICNMCVFRGEGVVE